MTLRTVLVDDEPTARRALTKIIENYTQDVEIVATADDVLAGVKAINNFNPDLVFLDVRMPNYSGFSLVEFFDELNFKLVFTTAYEQYAPQAFQAGASGYLLKPIDIDDLNTVIEKVKMEINEEQSNFIVSGNKSISYNRETGITILPSVGGLLRLQASEILYFEAKGRQVELSIQDGTKLLANISLKTVLEVFDKSTFVRIHKSYVVNFIHIKRYNKGKDCFIVLYNDTNLSVGKVYKDGLTEIISYLPK